MNGGSRNDHPRSSRWRALALFLIKALVTIAAFVWVLYQANIAGIAGSFTNISGRWFIAGCFILMLHFAIMVWRWRFVLRQACGANVPFYRLAYVFGLGEIVGAFFPSFIGIDIIRTVAVGGEVPKARVLESVFADRVLGLVALLVLIALVLPAFALTLGTGLIFLLLCLMSFAGLALFGLSLYWPSILTWAPVVGPRLKPLLDVLRILSMDRSLAGTILGSGILMHILALAIFWAAANMLGLPLDFFNCLLIAPGALLIASLPISLGGWGIREGALVAGFGLVGADPETITAASICYGLSGILSGAIGVLYAGLAEFGNRLGGRPRV